MNSDIFNDKIMKTIDECSYKFYIIQADKNISCTCTNYTTKQANVECKTCLGTGYKITIKIIKGASNEEMKGRMSIGPDATQVIRKYFIKYNYKVNETDLFVDDNSIYYVNRIEDMRGLQGIFTHQEVTAIKLKNDHNIRLANFLDILNKKLKKK